MQKKHLSACWTGSPTGRDKRQHAFSPFFRVRSGHAGAAVVFSLPGAPMTAHGYRQTLTKRGLSPFLWTQFLGAFNDNLFKIVVSMLAVHAATEASAGRQLSLVGIFFILPLLLFSG